MITMPALAITAGRIFARIVRSGLDLAIRRPCQVALLIALGWIAWTHFSILPGRDAEIARQAALVETRTGERDEERKAHIASRLAYFLAEKAAARAEDDRLARVEAEQQEITDDTIRSFEARLADARAVASRLREQSGNVPTGARPAGSTDSLEGAALSQAAGGPDETAALPRLPDPADELHWRLVATEQAIQLDELISWVEAQSTIDPNAGPGSDNPSPPDGQP